MTENIEVWIWRKQTSSHITWKSWDHSRNDVLSLTWVPMFLASWQTHRNTSEMKGLFQFSNKKTSYNLFFLVLMFSLLPEGRNSKIQWPFSMKKSRSQSERDSRVGTAFALHATIRVQSLTSHRVPQICQEWKELKARSNCWALPGVA